MRMSRAYLSSFGVLAAMLGCAGGGTGGTGGSGQGGNGSASSTASGTASSTASSTGSSAGGGSSVCPHVNLGSTVPTTHQGNTTGLPNLADSARLEWGTAPDDTLLFTAPAAGTYRISLLSEPSTNGGCSPSMQEFANAGTTKYYDESWCPAAGMVSTLDGIYAASLMTTSNFQMVQGQKVLIWMSCTTWSDAQAGAYSLKIEKL
jgi:hypothetical protein